MSSARKAHLIQRPTPEQMQELSELTKRREGYEAFEPVEWDDGNDGVCSNKAGLLDRLLVLGQQLVNDCGLTEEEVDRVIRECKKKNNELWR